tara:strand:- start:562 stop:708 length:147 start_codon:yes stop_codon:yes gene_type:complete
MTLKKTKFRVGIEPTIDGDGGLLAGPGGSTPLDFSFFGPASVKEESNK